MRTILILIRKEFLHVVRDRATLFQVLAIPMVQLVVLSFAATFEIRETRMYLVDQDRSALSHQLAARFEASRNFRIVGASSSLDAADRALLDGATTMTLHIPPGFERDIVRDRAASTQLILNAEQGAAAGVVRAYAGSIIAAHARDAGSTTTVMAAAAAPIDVRTRGWYNPRLQYTDYMVPGILVALVTLIGTLLTAQNIARERELGTLEQLNVTPLTRTHFIAGKLAPFWILAMVELAAGLLLARFAFAVPMHGSLLLVFAVAAIYLLAALGLGLLISTVAETQQQAMFVTFFVMMVYLLMSGLYTPITSMPVWMQWLAELNPVKHFVFVMRAVLVKGAGPAAVVVPVAVLTLYATLILTLAVRQYSKRSA